MGFQTRVQRNPAPATKGDFADANIRATVLAGAGAFVSAPPPRSPIVGNFAWFDFATGLVYGSNYGEATTELAFIKNERQALITAFLADNQARLESGQNVTGFNQGSFWTPFPGGALPGQKVFANNVDGSVYAAAAGTSTQVATGTASIAATGVMTVTALATGTFGVGNVIAGVNVPAGVAILRQLTGAAGGVGTYQTTSTSVSAGAAVTASGSVETTYGVDSDAFVNSAFTASIDATGLMTVTAVASGVLDEGQILAGSNVPTNARIVGQVTGAVGGVGTYLTSIVSGQVVVATAVTGSQGQMAKISTWG